MGEGEKLGTVGGDVYICTVYMIVRCSYCKKVSFFDSRSVCYLKIIEGDRNNK